MNFKKNNQKYKVVKLLLVLALFSFVGSIKAQGNLLYSDDRPIHFGFTLGTSLAGFSVQPSGMEIDGDVYRAEVSSLIPGFTAGFITDLRLSQYFNLRFTPFVFFTERKLSFQNKSGGEISKEGIFSIPLALPLSLKYSSERVGNYRPYLITGGGICFDFARNKEKNILLKPFDFYIDFGFGCDLYFSFFKLAPELKFAIGFNNVLSSVGERDQGGFDPKFTNAISTLTTKMLILSFNFE